jgi:hypothetical protein
VALALFHYYQAILITRRYRIGIRVGQRQEKEMYVLSLKPLEESDDFFGTMEFRALRMYRE